MRRLRNHVADRARNEDLCCLTEQLLLPHEIDLERLQGELKGAEKLHAYTDKAFGGWKSIPLRSVGGETGSSASNASGVHASSDASLFEDTLVMNACPYMKELIDVVAGEGGGVLKVRLMRLEAGRVIGPHKDYFKGPLNAVRMHIPIVTHPRVRFQVNYRDYQLDAGQLYSIDVTQLHSVSNKSHVDRVHLIFDVLSTPRVQKAINDAAIAKTMKKVKKKKTTEDEKAKLL
jgi:quercetin dioxygenase-like cupin family protein